MKLRRPRTTGGLLRTLGRGVLWGFVAVLLIRGAASLANTAPDTAPPATVRADTPRVPEQAEAFAVRFARAYLEHDPKAPDVAEAQLRALVNPDLASSITPERPAGSPRATTDTLTVAHAAITRPGRYRITVNARVTTKAGSAYRQLSVPVAQTPAGLVVTDYPAYVNAPGTAAVNEDPGYQTVNDPQIIAMLDRFFRLYLAGDANGVQSGPAAPGARLGAVTGGPLTFEDLVRVRDTDTDPKRTTTAFVTLRARDPRARATLALSYTVELEHGDRWYVKTLNPIERNP